MPTSKPAPKPAKAAKAAPKPAAAKPAAAKPAAKAAPKSKYVEESDDDDEASEEGGAQGGKSDAHAREEDGAEDVIFCEQRRRQITSDGERSVRRHDRLRCPRAGRAARAPLHTWGCRGERQGGGLREQHGGEEHAQARGHGSW